MRTIAPVVAEMDGVPSPGRRQSVQVHQGQVARIAWTLRDDRGNAVALDEPISSSGTSETPSRVRVRILEALSYANSANVVEVYGSIENGKLVANLTPEVTKLPGIYHIEWALLGDDDQPVYIDPGYLVVNRSLSAADPIDRRSGAPTVAEIRLHMRDSGAEDNYLLDSVEFDLSELAACVERGVQIWNDTMDFVGPKYTTHNFPYRSQWLDSIIGNLYLLAAQNYRRNFQQYQAGGTAMNDKAKAQEYDAIGRGLVKEYKDWVKSRKVALNIDAAFGGTRERRGEYSW